MEQGTQETPTLYEKISRFAKTSTPPASKTAPSKVKAAGPKTRIAAIAMLVVPVLLILLVRMIMQSSFFGDLFVLGLIGFIGVAILYAISTYGSVFFSKRARKTKENWVAAAVLDQETNYEEGIPEKRVILELEDGRRVTLSADERTIEIAKPGRIGWASIRKANLLDFAAG